MKTEAVNRFEIIDHTQCETCKGAGFISASETDLATCSECGGMGCPGRKVIFWDDKKQLDIELQDDDRTLKIFVHERYKS